MIKVIIWSNCLQISDYFILFFTELHALQFSSVYQTEWQLNFSYFLFWVSLTIFSIIKSLVCFYTYFYSVFFVCSHLKVVFTVHCVYFQCSHKLKLFQFSSMTWNISNFFPRYSIRCFSDLSGLYGVLITIRWKTKISSHLHKLSQCAHYILNFCCLFVLYNK